MCVSLDPTTEISTLASCQISYYFADTELPTNRFHCLSTQPEYLHSLFIPKTSITKLSSSFCSQIYKGKHWTKDVSVAAPTFWKTLTDNVKSTNSLMTFHCLLESNLFNLVKLFIIVLVTWTCKTTVVAVSTLRQIKITSRSSRIPPCLSALRCQVSSPLLLCNAGQSLNYVCPARSMFYVAPAHL